LGVRGRLVMVAIHNEPRPVDLFRFFWRELTMVGARVYERTDYDRAIRLIERGDIPVGELISNVVPIDRAGDAFTSLGAGGSVMKVLVACSPGGAR
jgi:(R,R)-butanediol dehydrogenase / meso-butanediol dehydrogenase / diacetyl reductase